MTDLVQNLLRQYLVIWENLDTCLPSFERTFTYRDQIDREANLDIFLNALTREIKREPRTKSESRALQKRIFSAFCTFAKSALDFEDCHLQVLRDFVQTATDFAQHARSFDPSLSGAEIFQAMRNVWTTNGLQLLLGLPVELTPATFAYSMLYPYTDNYLDDPAIAKMEKESFNERFGQRLNGENVTPENVHWPSSPTASFSSVKKCWRILNALMHPI